MRSCSTSSLPVLDGWTVLDRLKQQPATRHIPVHIVSGVEEMQPALMAGAAAFVQKPASLEALEGVFGGIESFIDRDVRRLLVVEDDEAQRNAIVELVGGDDDVEIIAVGSSRGGARGARLGARVRLHGARPEAAEDDRLRPAREGEDDRALAGAAGHRLHGQGADAARGDEAEAATPRRSSSRTCARRSGCSTRPRSSCTASRRSCPSTKRQMLEQLHDADARLRRQEGADRRRRRAQHLRAHERARGARDGGALRRERPRGDRGAASATATSTSC